jgi:hypothetical protein
LLALEPGLSARRRGTEGWLLVCEVTLTSLPGACTPVTLHARAPGESAAQNGPGFPARAITTAVRGGIAVRGEAGEEAEGAPLGDAWCRGGVIQAHPGARGDAHEGRAGLVRELNSGPADFG